VVYAFLGRAGKPGNHVNDLASIEFCIVPTIRFKPLFDLVVLAHSRREVLQSSVAENPSTQWTAQQQRAPRLHSQGFWGEATVAQ